MPRMYYAYCPHDGCPVVCVNHRTQQSLRAASEQHTAEAHSLDVKRMWEFSCTYQSEPLGEVGISLVPDEESEVEAPAPVDDAGGSDPLGVWNDEDDEGDEGDDGDDTRGRGDPYSSSYVEPRRPPEAEPGTRAHARSRSPVSPPPQPQPPARPPTPGELLRRGSSAAPAGAAASGLAGVAPDGVAIPTELPQTYHDQVIQVAQWLERASTILDATAELLETAAPRLRGQAQQARGATDRLYAYAYFNEEPYADA